MKVELQSGGVQARGCLCSAPVIKTIFRPFISRLEPQKWSRNKPEITHPTNSITMCRVDTWKPYIHKFKFFKCNKMDACRVQHAPLHPYKFARHYSWYENSHCTAHKKWCSKHTHLPCSHRHLAWQCQGH